ncbi:MAG: hypothetical protein CMM26_04655 [Rhodospirillaceae bacterium]|nr:hypothetical protein [Rhodospirillaceae bacterium]
MTELHARDPAQNHPVRSRWLLSLLLTCTACAPSQSPTPPNIVLIYADDLGWRDLTVQGSSYYETPNIDRLATEGIRFTDAYANAPNCAPSRAALMSGQYAPRTGIYTVASAARGPAEERALLPVENETTLDLDVVTIAEVLSAAGYATGHAGKWHLGGEGFLPEDQGFTWSIAGNEAGAPPDYFYPYARGDRRVPGLEDGAEGEYLPERLVDESIGFIDRSQDSPFFLYLSHYTVHTPIQAREEITERYRAKAPSNGHENPTYAAMIESLDQGVGRILDALEERGLSDNTVVIFASDNGGFGPVTSMAPLRGSKGMLYEGGIRTPLIMRWPDEIEPGATSATPVIGVDLYPTLAELAGAPLPDTQPLDGVSLLPTLMRSGDVPERDLIWHFPAYLEADRSVADTWRTTPASALRRGPYKVIHFFEDDRWEVYDLSSDASETNDLAGARPELTEALRSGLQTWWTDIDAFVPTEPNPLYRGEAN